VLFCSIGMFCYHASVFISRYKEAKHSDDRMQLFTTKGASFFSRFVPFFNIFS
jgi:hypothetical protein